MSSQRVFDLMVALAGLVLLAPVMLLVALVVRADCAGPILFKQERVGRDGRPFQILKFRTMRTDVAGRSITADGDARITCSGAVLRRWKLDELPQLINVVRGEMSLVGPRPEVPKYVQLYPDSIRAVVLSVRPGITDNASIEFRNESELLGRSSDPERTYVDEVLPRKLAMYVRYVKERSFSGDLRIIGKTFLALFQCTRAHVAPDHHQT